jgi:hypothetical protein
VSLTLFVIGELVVCALLGGAMFYALIWQPVWLQIFSAIVMAAGLGSISFGPRANRRAAWLVIWACPLAYSFWLLGLIGPNSVSAFVLILAHYLAGVLSLWLHLMLNRRYWAR